MNFLGGPLETDPKGNAWLARQIAEKTATTIAFFEQIITASSSCVKKTNNVLANSFCTIHGLLIGIRMLKARNNSSGKTN